MADADVGAVVCKQVERVVEINAEAEANRRAEGIREEQKVTGMAESNRE